MNKILLFTAAAILSAGTLSANNTPKKKDKKKKEIPAAKILPAKQAIKSRIDSASYAMGITQSVGLKNYIVQTMNVDTAYYADFLRGLREGMVEKTPQEKAYLAGQQIAEQFSGQIFNSVNGNVFKGGDSLHTLNKALMIEGFVDAVSEDSLRILGNKEGATQYLNTTVPLIQAAYMEEKYGAYKQENIDFLTTNKTKDSIQTTASGLQYKVITMGTGEKPKATDKVRAHYRGTLINGEVFDSSYERKEPLTIQANRVIKGWTEALTMMPVGSKWILYIPQELGYGDREAGKIPPFSTLIFEVELLGIDKPASAPATAIQPSKPTNKK